MTTNRIEGKNIIIIHAVIQEDSTELEIHTHGLDKYNHPEFSLIAESIFYVSACRLLNSLAEAVVNDDEVFKDSEICDWSEWGLFSLENNIDSFINIVLRIVPLQRRCEVCEE